MTDTRQPLASPLSNVIRLHPASTGASGTFRPPLSMRLHASEFAAVEAPRPAANDSGRNDNPCLSCGACCAHFRVSFYCGELAAEQPGAPGGTVPPELTVQVGPLRAAMKGTEYGNQRCVALRGELGQPGIHCAIYPLRPSPCREFDPWMPSGEPNPDCQRVRAKFGLPALPWRSGDDQDPPHVPPTHHDAA